MEVRIQFENMPLWVWVIGIVVLTGAGIAYSVWSRQKGGAAGGPRRGGRR